MSIVFSKIRKYKKLDNIDITESTLLFYGDSLDERGRLIINHLEKFNCSKIKFVHDDTLDSFSINEEIVKRHEINMKKMLVENSLVLIEATTLGYVEIVTLLFLLNNLNFKMKIKIFYAEPEGYTKKENSYFDDVYNLSSEYKNYKYIKPFIFKKPQDSLSQNKASLVTILGFEENRLGRIIEDNDADMKYNEFISIISVPGFIVGWENISLSKHYHLLNNVKSLYYTPADNPYETYKVLNNIVENLNGKKIAIMPIGTKPCTIGTSVFMVNKYEEIKKTKSNLNISTKYDFPIKSTNRTFGISDIYEYELKIN